MIHHILRGRWLYIGLVALLGALYLRGMSMREGVPGVPFEESSAPAPSRQMELWPKQLDAEAFQRALKEDPVSVFALSLLSTVMAGMAVVGFGLTAWNLGPGRRRPGGTWRRVTPWALDDLGRITALTIAAASLMPLARALLLFRAEEPPDLHVWMTSSMLALDAFLILVVLAFSAGKRSSFGLTNRRPAAAIRDAVREYLTAFPWLFVLLFLVVEFVRRMGWTPPPEPIHELIFGEDRPHVIAMTVFLACLVGPIAEELFFRGVLYGALRQRLSRGWAIVASSAAFALLHANPVGLFPIMALGCLLAYLYERSGTLLAPLVIHIAHNTLLMSFALILRRLLDYA